LVGAAKDGISTVASIIPGKGDVKEEVAEKEKEVKDKVEEAKEEKTPIIEQAKALARKASQKLEEYRDSGDLSSETTIQPNREGPSVLDKANEEYGKVANKVVEKVEEVVGANTEEGESFTDKVKEKAIELKDRLTPSSGEEGFTEIKSGFSETVEELRQERGEGEFRKQLNSKNPFEKFAGENQKGGKPIEKTKETFNEATNKISEKLVDTKEKIKSAFVQPDKENAPQSTA